MSDAPSSAVSEGLRIAETFFQKKGGPQTYPIDFIEMAGMLAIAFEQGLELGIVSAKVDDVEVR